MPSASERSAVTHRPGFLDRPMRTGTGRARGNTIGRANRRRRRVNRPRQLVASEHRRVNSASCFGLPRCLRRAKPRCVYQRNAIHAVSDLRVRTLRTRSTRPITPNNPCLRRRTGGVGRADRRSASQESLTAEGVEARCDYLELQPCTGGCIPGFGQLVGLSVDFDDARGLRPHGRGVDSTCRFWRRHGGIGPA